MHRYRRWRGLAELAALVVLTAAVLLFAAFTA
jgi:hypothetical protein